MLKYGKNHNNNNLCNLYCFSVLLRVELRDKIENWIFPGEQEGTKNWMDT